MTTHDDDADLVGQIYEAALDTAKWDTVLERLFARTGTNAGSLWLSHPDEGRLNSLRTVNLEASALNAYARYYWQTDIWDQRGRVVGRPGQVLVGDRFVPMADLHRSEFYNDFLKPADHGNVLSLMGVRDRNGLASISLYRPDRTPDFSDAQIEAFAALAPHITRALRLHRALDDARMHSATLTAVLNQVAVGLILLDARGRVVFANRSAEQALQMTDGLGVENARLVARAGAAHETLERLIASAARSSRGSSLSGEGGAVALPRPSGRRDWQLVVAPLPRDMALAGAMNAAVLVWITDPEAAPVVPAKLMRQLFDLSIGEAETVAALAMGASVAEIADRRGVSTDTVSTQLKRAMRKAGLTRQAELIQLWLRLTSVDYSAGATRKHSK